MADVILETISLCKKYGKNGAVNDLTIQIPQGTVVGLLGPNGSGKTTFIKMAAGLLEPSSGELLIHGMRPSVETKKSVAYLPDHAYLTSWMTIEQMIGYYEDFFADFRKEKALKMIHDLGLNETTLIQTLSKGNKEKVALILCMSREAKLYLLDEPIAGVDPATRDYILNTILMNRPEESSVIISTHLIADVESVLSDVILIKDGRVFLTSRVDELKQKEGKSVDEYFREVFKW